MLMTSKTALASKCQYKVGDKKIGAILERQMHGDHLATSDIILSIQGGNSI